MNDRDFMRYSRQILLDDIALDGQQKLLDSQVLIIGLGGLGTPAALYLAGAGVGTLVLADDDDVHLSNLQRQILFTTEDIDRPKSQVSHQRLTQLNPDIQLTALQQRLTGEALKDAVARADVVLDCTDNMATRQEINTACVALNTPLITASAVGFGGQLMVLTPPWEQGCYRCLWPDTQDPERNCRTAGVVGPVVGVMGTLQALEAIKLLSGIETLRENSDCSTVSLASGAAWRCAAPVVAQYAEEAMQILFNDQPMQCAAGQTVHELLEQLDQRQAGAALAINQQIVPREQWAQHIVQDGDQILLFQVIAGG
ncbi:thiazole biosynthesis protein ThiF [Escherichia coli]|uniref:Thiazole biosynthesis protein ThiF n=31 Tax=Enterobacteriaceae TaxID=543 RepID=A0A377DCU6_ECOLX|nr:thiazole biosynthesis protein ThiF [Escherichia coli]